MVKTQVYLREEELLQLHAEAERSGRSVAALVREAVRVRWVDRPEHPALGPIAIWKGPLKLTSMEHDRIYDDP